MKSISELEAVRTRTLAQMKPGAESSYRMRVLVGMATCGIAAGAKLVHHAIRDALAAHGVEDVSLIATGCIGACRLEPIVEIVDANGDKTTYVHMDAEKAKQVVEKHIIGGAICNDWVIGTVDA